MFRKIILFISSYIPLYVLMVIKNILERTTNNGKFRQMNFREIVLFDEINDYALIILSLLCINSLIYLVVKIKNTDGEKYYEVISVEDQTTNYYFNYISIYLISCLGLSLNKIVDVFVLFFLMTIVGVIYISNKMTYMNPTLNLLGYKVYNTRLKSKSSQKEFNSILIVPRHINIKQGIDIKGTGKQDFIFAKTSLNEE